MLRRFRIELGLINFPSRDRRQEALLGAFPMSGVKFNSKKIPERLSGPLPGRLPRKNMKKRGVFLC